MGAPLEDSERLPTPLIRNNTGVLERASWDDALDLIASRFSETQTRYGADAVGVFGGGSLTNEKAYLLGKFARVALGTSNIDYNGRFCMSSAAGAGVRGFGNDPGRPFPGASIAPAGSPLLVRSNPAGTV